MSSSQSVMFICMGNICRSPAAHAILEDINKKKQYNWKIDSCGTYAYHQGHPPDYRMLQQLQINEIEFLHRSQLFRVGMAYDFDLLLAMDLQNYNDVLERLPDDSDIHAKLQLFRNFDPQVPSGTQAEVPDPYYRGLKSFPEVYQMIERCCQNLAEHLSISGGKT